MCKAIKQPPYLIAVDLDGTLFYTFNTYDKKSTRLLRKIAKNNIVVIATGRPYRSSGFYHKILKLNTPIINYNGALVQSKTDPLFTKKYIYIDKQDLIKFADENNDLLFNIFCEVEDDIYLLKDDKSLYSFLHLDGGILHIGKFQDILDKNPNGAVGFCIVGNEDKLITYVNNNFNGRVKIRFWPPSNNLAIFEFYSPLTSKGHAILDIANYYNIPKERIITIGDGPNDIEMLECGTYGVAMGNSHPNLLEVAKIKTTSIDEHGVYKFLKIFFYGKQKG